SWLDCRGNSLRVSRLRLNIHVLYCDGIGATAAPLDASPRRSLPTMPRRKSTSLHLIKGKNGLLFPCRRITGIETSLFRKYITETANRHSAASNAAIMQLKI